jgi:hypothetical protein
LSKVLKRAASLLLTCVFGNWLYCGTSAAQNAAQKTVLDGVFTSAQALRGGAVWETAECARCHDDGDADGPVLVGPAFVDRWREDTLDGLFAVLKDKMPGDAPGSLSDPAYLDLVAYLLQLNDYPAGNAELTAPLLATTLLTSHDGPKPLPTNATVQTVGCLSTGPGNVWLLSNAGEPVRSRAEMQVTEEEKKLAESQPLGQQTFRLLNVTEASSVNLGHKVLAKGVLARQSNGDRINVTTLRSVSSTCVP